MGLPVTNVSMFVACRRLRARMDGAGVTLSKTISLTGLRSILAMRSVLSRLRMLSLMCHMNFCKIGMQSWLT